MKNILYTRFLLLLLAIQCHQYNCKAKEQNVDTIGADISFCIADIKFDGENFKICEFGEARFSTFKGLDNYFWDKYWHYLKQFNLPIWHIGHCYLGNKFKEMRAYESLVACGGKALPSFNLLEKEKKFQDCIGNGYIDKIDKISSYKAIVCTTSMNSQVKDFKNKHPNVLVLDLATAPYVRSKNETVKILNDHQFRKYCPKFKLLERKNSPDISEYAKKSANLIIKEFNSDYYVVKPVNGTMGRGVFIISRDELSDILNCTLRLYPDIKNKTDKKTNDPVKYWQQNKNPLCLVEEFAKSKIIKVSNKLYDPTIRLIFILCYDNNIPKIEILGGYWKTPCVALNESGDFTAHHKSGTTEIDRTDISSDDYQVITTLFKDFMLRLYLKMLHIT